MSKTKDVYQTIKRQISATTNGILPNTLRKSSSSHLALKDPQSRWVHPSPALTQGVIQYGVKMLGFTEVSEAKGAHVIRDAIHAIRFQLQVSGMSHNVPKKPQKVELQINTKGVQIVDMKTKKVLFSHPLHKISFCADDKQDKRVFAYIASDEKNKHICYLFLSDKNAEQITLTIGEAFDLAFQEYIDKETTKVLPPGDDVTKLKERIAELEAENRAKDIELQFYKKQYGALLSGYSPSLPESPVPKVPTTPDSAQQVKPLLPPPSTGRKHPPLPPLDPSNPLFGVDLSGPEVGRKLENLNIDKMDNVFDDSFDPRAGEKKETKNHDTLNKQNSDPKSDEADDLEAMLAKCDSRINEIGGFTNPRLEYNNSNGKHFEDEHNDFSAPSTSHQK